MLRVEAVHLDEQLVQRLLAFVVTAAEPGAAVATDRVDLVDEHDRRRRVLRLLRTGRARVTRRRPTNISTKSEPLIEKNGTPASPATALASSVLPVPGGPKSSTPFGILAPRSSNLRRRGEEVLDLLELLDRLVEPGDVGERDRRLVLADGLGARPAEAEHAAPPPCAWPMNQNTSTERRAGTAAG